MNKKQRFVLATLVFGASAIAWADPVRDTVDLWQVHQHLTDAIKEMEHAEQANHFDMSGHARKAEQLMREAQQELQLAVDSAKSAH